MSEGKKKKKRKDAQEAQPVAEAREAASTPETAVKAKPARVREALALVKRHPVGVVVAVGAAVALVEIELAVGILTGVGATALLATKSGPEARQEVRNLGHEVLTRGKAAVERARVALASRAKAQPAELAAAATTAPAGAPASVEPAAPKAEAEAPKADEPAAQT